ncbi:MAG: recombinase A [Deltaproteobacteria bacterium GWA2_57_13]|nr:MAG: recombinase A [Deltaproteobacteria bacterium GWA2_57_13]
MNSFSAQKLRQDIVRSSPWSLSEIAGRLVEISGSGATAALTLAFGLVLEGQRQGELVGWVTSTESSFYPPDTAQEGVDLDALVVVRVPDAQAIPRAGEKLLRSGAFGLVVLDLGSTDIPMPLQARLAALSLQHHTVLLCLTEKESREPSLGSLISLRVYAERKQNSAGQFACELSVLKDKRRGPTWTETEVCCGPAGLC